MSEAVRVRRFDTHTRSEDRVEEPGAVHRGVKGGATSRHDETARWRKKGAGTYTTDAVERLGKEHGLPANHLVHVERMMRPRIRKRDHAGGWPVGP